MSKRRKTPDVKTIAHPIAPVFDRLSRVLILGSFPSVRSREEGFFYGNPQNRFWQTLAAVFDVSEPKTIEEKTDFLLSHRVALWDVIATCEIAGSSDSSIRNVTPNDLSELLRTARISAVFTNGKTAERLYHVYQSGQCGLESICLPSTSPANAAWTRERLIAAWREVAHALEAAEKEN